MINGETYGTDGENRATDGETIKKETYSGPSMYW